MIPKAFWRFEAEGTRIHLRLAGDEMDMLLSTRGVPASTRLAARLLCEEVVLNALEHGGATFVTMELEPAKDPYLLIFEDDGVSFDPATRATTGETDAPGEISTRGRGLLLMRRWTGRMEHRREDGRNKLSVMLVA